MTAGKNVYVRVIDSLSAVGPGVYDKTIAVRSTFASEA